MTMMHLRFPRKKGFFSWDELGCMNRALGFPASMFNKCMPDEYTEDEPGVSTTLLLNMVNVQKFFHKAIDCSFNIHTDEWNLSVINKAVALLDSRIISFEELHAVRVAFQVYENADTKGMVIDNKVLQRALKMCGRMISPLKMMHRIKHMRGHFEEENRIQLHEFLDLLLWCEPYEEMDIQPPEMDTTKDEKDMFALDDFEAILQHYDEKLASKLNHQYIGQEWKFSREKHGSKRLPRDVPPVDPQVRKKQVGYHRERYRHLQNEVTSSQSRVYRAQAGYIRERPITAPDLLMYDGVEPSTMAVSTLQPRPQTVYQTFGHIIRPVTSDDGRTRPEIWEEFPRPEVPEYQRPKTPVAVTPPEIESTGKDIEALRFEMETIEMKYRQLLNEDMDFILPGYRDKMASRQSEPPPPAPKQPKQREVRPTPETLERLAYPPQRGPPPSHAKICDARFRGWHKVSKRKGPHFVLAAPAYDLSNKGQLLQKIARSSQEEIQRGDYIYRSTRSHQVARLPGRPHTSPAELPSQVPRNTSNPPPSRPSNTEIRVFTAETEYSGRRTPENEPSDDGSSVVSWTDLQMFTGEGGELEPLREADTPVLISPTKSLLKKPSTPGEEGGQGLGQGQVVELKKVGKVAIMEEIRESEYETPEEHSRKSVSQSRSRPTTKQGSPGNKTPSEMGKGKVVTILTPTTCSDLDFIPRTSSAEWIRDILGSKGKDKKKKISRQSISRLCVRAADVGSKLLQQKLMATVS